MDECGLHHRSQFGFGGHMRDRVMDEDSVKDSAQPDRSDVADDVLELGVACATRCEHLGGSVDKGHRETLLEVGGVVAYAGP